MYIIKDEPEIAEKKLEEFASEYNYIFLLINSVKGFIKSAEFDCAEKMIQSYMEGDQAEFTKQANRNIVHHIFPLQVRIYGIFNALR
jgi:hypothetical protein